MNTEKNNETEGTVEEQEFSNLGQKASYIMGVIVATAILLSSLLAQLHNGRMQEIQAHQAQQHAQIKK
jgi:hypothetical protein